MQKISHFIIKNRFLLLGVVVLLAIVSCLMMFHVPIIEDMAKYLPDESNMRIGLSLMENSFPESSVYTTNSGIEGINLSLIFTFAVLIVLVILFIMCTSWLEPILFTIVIGIAILINMGTNMFLGEVSKFTVSLAPCLIMVLSMDYSIMLSNRYKQEKILMPDIKEAMKRAVETSFSSIFASAFTTIVGLLVLVCMSFKIGGELGIILAKGVFISMICVFTLLPCLLITCNTFIEKTIKKTPHFSMNFLASYSYKSRKIIPILFVVLFIFSAIFQSKTEISFIDVEQSLETTRDNSIIVLYETEDEKNINSLIDNALNLTGIKEITGYTNTLGQPFSAEEMIGLITTQFSSFPLDPILIKTVYYNYYEEKVYPLSIEEFLDYISNDIAPNKIFSPYFDSMALQSLSKFAMLTNSTFLQAEISASQVAQTLMIPQAQVDGVFYYYYGATGKNTMTIPTFVNMVLSSGGITDKTLLIQLEALQQLFTMVLDGHTFTPMQMHSIFGVNGIALESSIVELLFLMHSAKNHFNQEWELSLHQFVQEVSGNLLEDGRYGAIFTSDIKDDLLKLRAEIDSGVAQLRGDTYSRCIITSDLPIESLETTKLISSLHDVKNNHLEAPSYLIGEACMAYEMAETFQKELIMITLLTAIAIFLVIICTSRSICVAFVLVILVQCSVFLTTAIVGFIGDPLYFLALLIVQSILMGATIDYAILFTNNYREYRQVTDIIDSLHKAYQSSSHTIITSGSILIIATLVLGSVFSGSTSQVCYILSLGSFLSVMLIVLVLPSVIALFDAKIIKKN